MKFTNSLNLKIIFCYLIVILLISSDIAICLSTKAKAKSKAKSKAKLKAKAKLHSKTKIKTNREASLMETINNYFSEKNTNENIFKEKEQEVPTQSNLIYKPRFKSNEENPNENDEDSFKEIYKNNDMDNFYKFKESKNLIKTNNKIRNYGLYDAAPSKKTTLNNKKAETKADNGELSANHTSTNFWQNRIEKKIKKTTKILQEDWFMISSSSFKSNYFPAIKINKNEVSKINIDDENFRINDAFQLFTGKNKPPSEKYFWFRLSGLNFYYSVSVCDTNILGSISMENTNPPSENFKENHHGEEVSCFTISDNSAQIWKICGKNELKIKLFSCQINRILGIRTDSCRMHKKKNKPKNIAIQPMIIIPKPSRNCNDGWNYLKKGEDWECDCKEGREQSPIDLPYPEVAIESPVTPLFHFHKVSAESESGTIDGILRDDEGIKIKIWDNSLRILNPDMGRAITVDGAVYKAEEIVLHTPSEHTLQGKKYDAEMQILFYGQSKGDIAKQVVLSFLFEAAPGEYNKFFDSIDSFNFPNAFHNEKILKNDIFIPDIFHSMDEEDVNSLKKFSFFTYQGSLTFPPCTENTIMYVASKPIPLSTTTLTLIQEAARMPDKKIYDNKIYLSDVTPENDRKIQNTNGRPVFYYNHEKYCGPDAIKKPKDIGHYEKIKLMKEKIFYVGNNKPSGLPEAFVIGKDEAFGKHLMPKA